MSIHWFMTFLTLVNFILVNSNELTCNINEKDIRKIQGEINYKHNKDEDISSEEKFQHLITALLKIVESRLAKDAFAVTKDSTLSHIIMQIKSLYENNDAFIKHAKKLTLRATKLSSKSLFDILFDNVSNKQKFHCETNNHVYIPDVDEMIPSYKCKLGNKIFILSSKRFLEDRRRDLYVNIDDNTIAKLYNSVKPFDNGYNIISTSLNLNLNNEDYDIHT